MSNDAIHSAEKNNNIDLLKEFVERSPNGISAILLSEEKNVGAVIFSRSNVPSLATNWQFV